ncbi:MAG: hypothetical protein ACREC2_06390, partial [Bradyrhizobium sp.]
SLYAHARHFSFAYETAGAARARHSLRPWFIEGQAYGKNSGDLRRGNAESHPTVVIPGRASFLARARNPSNRDRCGPMDSGFALRAPRNDEGEMRIPE